MTANLPDSPPRLNRSRHRRTAQLAAVALAVCLAGPANLFAAAKKEPKETKREKPSKKDEGKDEPRIFFPMPPDAPRVQFLVSFSSSDDLPGTKRGKLSGFITGAAAPKEELMKPYGLAIHRGRIEITDTVINTIQIIDLEKWKMRAFSPRGEAIIRVPINVAIDEDGTRYVADTGRSQIVMFDSNDKYLGAIGARDEMRPTDVAITPQRLYITDLKGHTVRVYDKKSRQLLFTLPREPITETNQLYSPTNLATDQQGNVYVSDTGAFRVLKYGPDGNYLRAFARHGGDPGTLARPKGIAVDREGRVYVIDAATQVLQMWDAEGRLLLFFGEPGSSPVEFTIPSKVVIDYEHVAHFKRFVAPEFQVEHLIFVVNQYGDRKVSVFGFGQKKP